MPPSSPFCVVTFVNSLSIFLLLSQCSGCFPIFTDRARPWSYVLPPAEPTPLREIHTPLRRITVSELHLLVPVTKGGRRSYTQLSRFLPGRPLPFGSPHKRKVPNFFAVFPVFGVCSKNWSPNIESDPCASSFEHSFPFACSYQTLHHFPVISVYFYLEEDLRCRACSHAQTLLRWWG